MAVDRGLQGSTYVMGIIDQVSALVNRDRPRADAIAAEWQSSGSFSAAWMKEQIPDGIANDIGVGGLIGRDPRLLREWEINPDGVAAAAIRVESSHIQAATLGNEPRSFSNRMLYDLALQDIAKETLREDDRIKIPYDMFDLVGTKAAENIAYAVHDLDRGSREKLASGVTEGLPRDFLEKATAPLPKLERTYSESDRRREREGRPPRQSMGKIVDPPVAYDPATMVRGTSAGR